LRFVIRLIVVFVGLGFVAVAQNTLGDLSGQVTDASGAVVPGATVTVKNLDTGTVLQITTDDSGRFATRVPLGRYDITVLSPGFKKYVEPNISVSVGQTKNINIVMSVGNIAEAVTLTSGFSSVELTWNAWAEPASPSPSFSPVSFLEPGGKNYSLILDLAAFAYSDGPDTYSRGVGGKVREWLLSSKAPDTELKLLVIPDEKFFEPLPSTQRAITLPVDLKQLRRALKAGVQVTREPFEILKGNPKAGFSFGRVSLNLRTRSQEGVGSVAIALWADGTLPVDELSIPLCVAADAKKAEQCKEGDGLQDSLSGIDPIRVSAQQRAFAMKPNAALHFIELDSATTVGVFRDNAWPAGRYVSWSLGKSTKTIRNYLQQTLLPDFDRATNETELIPVGKALFNLLFPSTDARDARDAREAFAEFIRSQTGKRDAANPPSIFVRVLSDDRDDPPFLVPLGLMVHDINGQKDFLGFHFRMQTPLQIQDYQPHIRCIANWVVLAPPANASGVPKELNDALEQFSHWHDKWEFKPITNIPALIEWAEEDIGEKMPLSLFLLAHQDSNTLYFANSPRLQSEGILRRFKTPSVAIVNGCSTSAPGSSAIVEKLNSRGVSTVIATAAKVHPRLAGDFFSVLGDYLTTDTSGEAYPLGVAHFLTLQKLRRMAPSGTETAYGAKVLAYELLGNSNVRVCSPPLRSRQSGR
jgi:hypothetical protein